MGKNEDLTDFKGKKMENFADTTTFNAGVKEKNTKTNKITIVKNQKLATQNFLFNMHINFPFGNI
jgi:bisphosphoglycerate-independent phosphoglycerate mutase (AlkP superfamily)